MSPRSLIEETVADLLEKEASLDAAAPEGVLSWRDDLWGHWSELGLAAASSPEDLGGGGIELADSCGILRVAAAKAAPLPVAETDFLAGWLIAQCGEQVSEGPLTVAPTGRDRSISLAADGAGWKLSGTAARVPWARWARRIVVLTEDEAGPAVVLVDTASCRLTPQPSLSIEPRDDVEFDGAAVESVLRPTSDLTFEDLYRRSALARSVQMLGAMETILDLTVSYARDRRQFGKPISRFQAVQHQLAAIARDVGLTRSAVGFAIEATALERDDALLALAIGKAVSSRRAGLVAARAHQVHGAIGFTREYRLQLFTTRLWEWRDEFGSEREWEVVIGRQASEAADLWSFVTQLEVVQ